MEPAPETVQNFYEVLLAVMKDAKKLGIRGRYDKLAPAVQTLFDLPAMTRIAVGPTWTSMTPEQQAALIDSFTHMTVATYANRFDGYGGERFEVEPTTTAQGSNRVVRTRLIESSGKATTLNYLTRESRGHWKALDVYLSGTVSELAARRSEFGAVLKSGGPDALVNTLRRRGENLLKTG